MSAEINLHLTVNWNWMRQHQAPERAKWCHWLSKSAHIDILEELENTTFVKIASLTYWHGISMFLHKMSQKCDVAGLRRARSLTVAGPYNSPGENEMMFCILPDAVWLDHHLSPLVRCIVQQEAEVRQETSRARQCKSRRQSLRRKICQVHVFFWPFLAVILHLIASLHNHHKDESSDCSHWGYHHL